MKALALILALVLGVTGCATRPPEPLTRQSVTLPAQAPLPAPPMPAVITCHGTELSVFDAAAAEQLANYILAAERLNHQLNAYRDTITALDIEAAAWLAVANTQRLEIQALERALQRERWTWRLGAAALGIVAVGVAAQ